MQLWFSRKDYKKYIRGVGIEIGALHNPLNLTGLPVTKISYVDRMSSADLRKQYPELNDLPLVPVDLIDDGSGLFQIPDGSLDFIIANNLIEHMDNPILALQNWYRKLRPSGILYMAVPDKRFTFDADRPLTTVQHLLEDYQAPTGEQKQRNFQHFVETAEIIEKRTGTDAAERVNDLIAKNYSIHFHTWDFQSFQSFLGFVISEMKIDYSIVDFQKTQPLKKEFIFILGKQVVYKKNFWGRRVAVLK